MSKMIEKVARSLSDLNRQQHPEWKSLTEEQRRDEIENSWEAWKPEAIAAITAMREPTEDMTDAIGVSAGELWCWRAMIDEALK